MSYAYYTVTVASLDTDGGDIAGFAADHSGAWVRAARAINQDSADALLLSLDGGTSWPISIAAGGYFDFPMAEKSKMHLGGSATNALHWKAASNTCDNPVLIYISDTEAEAPS